MDAIRIHELEGIGALRRKHIDVAAFGDAHVQGTEASEVLYAGLWPGL